MDLFLTCSRVHPCLIALMGVSMSSSGGHLRPVLSGRLKVNVLSHSTIAHLGDMFLLK